MTDDVDAVLLMESAAIFDTVRRRNDPHQLLAGLSELLSGTISALFFSNRTLYQSIQHWIRKANDFVGTLNKFCALVEQLESNELDTLLSADGDTSVAVDTDDNDCRDKNICNIENQQPDQQQRHQQQQQKVVRYNRSDVDQQLHSAVFAIRESANVFEMSVSKMRNSLAKFLEDTAAKSAPLSPYWSKLFALLFEPVN
uniref:DUF3453 domain-containing protein n=1 Tax=Globodera pallida TaxID=36090 RepID=A0A183BVE8_GLOPA